METQEHVSKLTATYGKLGEATMQLEKSKAQIQQLSMQFQPDLELLLTVEQCDRALDSILRAEEQILERKVCYYCFYYIITVIELFLDA